MINMGNNAMVNDGGGLFDSNGLIDTLIVDCSNLPKDLFSGMTLQFCNRLVQMTQKLTALREGIQKEKADLQEQIADKQNLIDELTATLYNVKIDRTGDDNNGRSTGCIE